MEGTDISYLEQINLTFKIFNKKSRKRCPSDSDVNEKIVEKKSALSTGRGLNLWPGEFPCDAHISRSEKHVTLCFFFVLLTHDHDHDQFVNTQVWLLSVFFRFNSICIWLRILTIYFYLTYFRPLGSPPSPALKIISQSMCYIPSIFLPATVTFLGRFQNRRTKHNKCDGDFVWTGFKYHFIPCKEDVACEEWDACAMKTTFFALWLLMMID